VKAQVSFWTFDEDDVIMKIYHKFSHQAENKILNKIKLLLKN
jgi:hypothetical protein